MSQNAMTHVVLTDDDGSGTTGTILNNALFDQLQDAVDTAIGKVVQSKIGTYTAVVTDDVILCNGTFTVTLYAASGNSGRFIEIKNIGTGTITVDGNSSETIDGETTLSIEGQYTSFTLLCDGSNWHIV